MPLARVSHPQQEEVASISVPARVDYIFRFSRQVALVLGQDAGTYLDVSHNCLNALSGERNTAYIQLSDKLNDIQVRCRIIEQLFSQELFDPEKPLVETIMQLSRKAAQDLSIIVEHGQHLSAQMLFELTQVNELGKRQKGLNVNILIAASNEAKSIVASNLATFEPRIAVLNASDGQIVPITAKDKKPLPVIAQFNFWRPLTWFLTGTFLLASITIGVLFITGSINKSDFSAPLTALVNGSSERGEQLANPELTEPRVLSKANEENVSVAQLQGAVPNALTEDQERATNKDVFLALTKPEQFNDKLPAEPFDILASLNATSQGIELSEVKPNSSENIGIERNESASSIVSDADISKVVVSEVATPIASFEQTDTKKVTSPSFVNNAYYEGKAGYVIQFAGFSSTLVMEKYIQTNESLVVFKSYQRTREGRDWYTLTSEIYQTRQQAQQALSQLPEIFSTAWVKSVAAVNKEITF